MGTSAKQHWASLNKISYQTIDFYCKYMFICRQVKCSRFKINDNFGPDENLLGKWKHLLGKCISYLLSMGQVNWKTNFLGLLQGPYTETLTTLVPNWSDQLKAKTCTSQVNHIQQIRHKVSHNIYIMQFWMISQYLWWKCIFIPITKQKCWIHNIHMQYFYLFVQVISFCPDSFYLKASDIWIFNIVFIPF